MQHFKSVHKQTVNSNQITDCVCVCLCNIAVLEVSRDSTKVSYATVLGIAPYNFTDIVFVDVG